MTEVPHGLYAAAPVAADAPQRSQSLLQHATHAAQSKEAKARTAGSSPCSEQFAKLAVVWRELQHEKPRVKKHIKATRPAMLDSHTHHIGWERGVCHPVACNTLRTGECMLVSANITLAHPTYPPKLCQNILLTPKQRIWIRTVGLPQAETYLTDKSFAAAAAATPKVNASSPVYNGN